MKNLLFLVHRIPFPPHKGDKIRSYRLLEYLAKKYRVHLVSFVDDENDWQYRETVGKLCESAYFGRLNKRMATLRSLRGFLSGDALTLPYYYQKDVAEQIRRITSRVEIDRVLVFSSCMAQYIMQPGFESARKIIDFVDVDSDKWRQYARHRNFPMNRVYEREAVKLESYEKEVARAFDASVFVSEPEARLFSEKLRDDSVYITHMENGVDTKYFSTRPECESPYPDTDVPRLVFTGAMDYWANVDAVSWFVEHVFPSVKKKYSNIEFYIVGMHPTKKVCSLAKYPGVTVTGAVPDVRPYLQYAQAVVAPLRIARGLQNKVLEAMAMGKPVVATPQAMEGISARNERDVFIAEDDHYFAEQVIRAIEEDHGDLVEAARTFVCEQFGWDSSLPGMYSLLEGAQAGH